MNPNGKKVLLVTDSFYPAVKGGELAVFEQLQYLASRGFSCSALYFSDENALPLRKDRVFRHGGIKLIESGEYSDKRISDTIKRENPSLVYTYSFPALKALPIAKRAGKRAMLGTYSIAEIYNIYTAKLCRCGKKQALRRNPASLFRLADVVLTSSDFARRRIEAFKKHVTSFPAVRVLYPVPMASFVSARGQRGRRITAIRPAQGKGLLLIAALAASMPEYGFLIVGKPAAAENVTAFASGLLKQLKNVRILPFQKEVRRVYAQTKILLVPSVFEETFSRVAWEAMSNGIPVIASNKGNLPFLVKSGGYLCEPGDIDCWRSRIRGLMEDSRRYAAISAKARGISRQYDYDEQMRKFLRIVKGLCS